MVAGLGFVLIEVYFVCVSILGLDVCFCSMTIVMESCLSLREVIGNGRCTYLELRHIVGLVVAGNANMEPFMMVS